MTISAFDSLLARELREKIEAEIYRKNQILVQGALDHFGYKTTTGIMHGMQTALDILGEIEKRMMSDQPKRNTAA